jgi:hypothetical protein
MDLFFFHFIRISKSNFYEKMVIFFLVLYAMQQNKY